MTRIGNTELEIFPLGLGTNTFGSTTDSAASEAILDAFLDGGGNFIDTADQYTFWVPGNQGGEAETILGNWLRRHGTRDRVIIATKVGGLPSRKGLAPDTIAIAAEESLRRLQTDYIDLYYAHFDEPERPIEEIASSFDRLVREGKVRHIAISNLEPDRIEAWMRVARNEQLATPVALQPEYSLVRRRNYERNVAPVAKRHGLSVFPYYALASGFLTGKYRTREDLEGATRGRVVAEFMNEEGLEVVDVLRGIASERGVAVPTVALAWILKRPAVTAPLASANSRQQLDQLLAAPGLELTRKEIAALDKASAPFA